MRHNKIPWWYGVEFYFRNNSTGNPTLRHIVMESEEFSKVKTYCGFKSPFTESVISDESDIDMPILSICKKCLKAYSNSLPYPLTEEQLNQTCY